MMVWLFLAAVFTYVIATAICANSAFGLCLLYISIGLVIVVVCMLLEKLEKISKIDKLSKLDDLDKKLVDLTSHVQNSNKILNDINRHLCDGFNGIAEFITGK